MSLSPEDTAELARQVARVYGEAEVHILRAIAVELAKGVDAPDWAQNKADAATAIRQAAERALAKALDAGQAQMAAAITEAVEVGASAAVSEVAAITGTATAGELRESLNTDALDQLAAAHIDWETPPVRSVLRGVNDAYRRITSTLAARTLAGTETRRNTAQRVLWKATEEGVTSFTDKSGRTWELASWAEMSTRSATARASLDAHTRSLGDFGRDLVVVSDAPQECRLCRPYEGLILSSNGTTPEGVHQLESDTGGPPVKVRVSGSLRDARNAGLMHPNCRHRVTLYVPGATKRPTDTADPEGDRNRQKLRYLERQVRKWKKREAASLDESARKQARSKIRAYQGEIRDLVANSDLHRQRNREQLGQPR